MSVTRAVCDGCAAEDLPLHGGTITDESGGAWVELCPECWASISEERCAVCGEIDEGSKADSIYADGDEVGSHICDDCRITLLGLGRVRH